MISLNLWTSNRTETSCSKIGTFCHIVPLIFKYVYLKSDQPNSNSSLENRHVLSHRPPNFLNHFLEISAKVPRSPEKFVYYAYRDIRVASRIVHIFMYDVSRGASEQWSILKSSCIVNHQLNMLFLNRSSRGASRPILGVF